MAFKDVKEKTAYQNKYIKEKYDRINLTVPQGRKADIQAVAKSHGLSVNGWINSLIDAALEQENGTGAGFHISEPPKISEIE